MKYIIFSIFVLLIQVNVYGLDGDMRGGFGRKGYKGGKLNSPSINHGWGWYERTTCNCKSGDGYACCLTSCRFDYCIKKNAIGTIAGTPPVCEHLQQQKIKLCIIPTIRYNNQHQNADGITRGEVLIRVTALRDSLISTALVATKIPMTMYELKVKQGIFLYTGMNKISFKFNDYLEKERMIEYQVYDCNDENVVDKEFETFTLSKISTLEKDGLKEKIQLREIKVPFGCIGPYYTVRTVVKKTEMKESPVKTGGRNSDLRTITLKDAKQVVYIDNLKGKIINVPFIEETLVKKTSERYKLNTASCQYKLATHEDVLPYYKYSPTFISNTNPGQPFTKDTVLKLQIFDGKKKEIRLPWITLKDNGHFSHKSHWTKEKTKSEKATELKKVLQVSAEGQSKLMILRQALDLGKALGQDAKCAVERNFYDVLENGANISHPSVSYEYSIDIYPASKSDINKAKSIIKRMESYSGSYTDEKQLYDGLNNPLYAPKSFEKEESSRLEKEPSGILDTLVDREDDEDEISIDDLKMFSK